VRTVGSIEDCGLGTTADWGICGRGRIFKEIFGNSIPVGGVRDTPAGLRGYPIANGSDIRWEGKRGPPRCIEPEEDEDE